jgi:hypothetical protein
MRFKVIRKGNAVFQDPTDEQFIELIFTSGDLLGMDYVEEAKKRRSAVVPLLCSALQEEENYKMEDQGYWGVIHAVYILGILGDIRSINALLDASRYADIYDIDWILDILPECYFRLGSGVIPMLKEYIEKLKPEGYLAIANEVIGLWNLWGACTEQRKDIEDFLLKEIKDKDTDPEIRANFIADFTQIGRKDLKPLFEDFYGRGEVDLNIFTRDDLDRDFDVADRLLVFHYDLEKFYTPEEIAKREDRRKEEKEKVMEEFILDSYKSIGRNEKCPCGSGKKFKNCHLPWTEKQLRRLKEKEESMRETMEKGMAIMAERQCETEIRRFLANKEQTHLFSELKEKVLELIDASPEDFIYGSFLSYFEPVFQKIAFEREGEFKKFVKTFMEYYNAVSRQHYDLRE